MKKDVANYISKCMEYQRVKVDHRHLASFLQPLPILEWKWEVVIIDFISKFPKTTRKHNSIMVVVDKLTKVAHFIPIKLDHKETNIANIYLKEIIKLHGIPKEIILERDPKFSSNFWKILIKGFDTNMNFSTTYHS
jgi:hypothetical protein